MGLARARGPEGITLREATRQAGVAPNAAYRHFANHAALFKAVRNVALAELARAMERRLDALQDSRSRVDYARRALHAVGLAYLIFARTETGLFRTAFAEDAGADEPDAEPTDERDAERAGRSGLNPFELLSAALDGLVAVGDLPASKRPGAEYLAWSAVHGLAMLSIDGPLKRVPLAEREALDARVVQMVEIGLRRD